MPQNKTFALFSANYLPNIGGVEKYTQNLAHALTQMGNRVIIITNNVFELSSHEVDDEGVNIVRLPCRKALKGRYPLPRRNREFDQLLHWIEGQALDYVIVNTRFYPHSLIGIDLAEKKGIHPLVIDHGSAHLTMGSSLIDKLVAIYEHAITKLVKRHSVSFYAVSTASALWLEHFGISALGTLCNSIDAERFINEASNRNFRNERSIKEDDFVVSFCGRLIPEKGIEALIDAACILRDREDIQFLLAGEGPLESLILKRELSNVHLIGKLDSEEVAALLKTSDAFCLPTRSEGFSTSLLEAASCGATPLVTPVGGVKELMPTKDYGLVLKKASGEEIAAGIDFLHHNPTLNKQMGSRLQRRVRKKFSWEATATRVIEACESANEK